MKVWQAWWQQGCWSFVSNRGWPFHSSQDLKSTALQVGLRAANRAGQPGPPLILLLVIILLLILPLVLLHHGLRDTLETASSLLNEHHVKVPEVSSVLLGLHSLDKLGVEAEVVSDAVLPTVVRCREEREVGASGFERIVLKIWIREGCKN